MSYDIYLTDADTGETLETDVPMDLRGGNYQVGGTTTFHLNVTYNYGEFFRKTIDKEKGIRFLYGKTGAETIPILKAAIEKLPGKPSDNYWDSNPGNAKRALRQLLAMAQIRPDGVWDGD